MHRFVDVRATILQRIFCAMTRMAKPNSETIPPAERTNAIPAMIGGAHGCMKLFLERHVGSDYLRRARRTRERTVSSRNLSTAKTSRMVWPSANW